MSVSNYKIADFMKKALTQGELALEHEEIPVGCVFVNFADGTVVASGYNQTNKERNGTCHAEIVAINASRNEP